jgi:hypothetical protein
MSRIASNLKMPASLQAATKRVGKSSISLETRSNRRRRSSSLRYSIGCRGVGLSYPEGSPPIKQAVAFRKRSERGPLTRRAATCRMMAK